MGKQSDNLSVDKKMKSAWQPGRPLERGNAAEQILHDLREQILNGELERGAKLPTEKQLSEAYGVSAATVRESMRGLTTAQLIEVRHGSGSYVTADTDKLIGESLRSTIQLENIGLPEVLGILGALNGYAAELAAQNASENDLVALEQALERINKGESPEEISSALTFFLDRIATASGNNLLAILCRFLASTQISLAWQLAGDSLERWQSTVKLLSKERKKLVAQIRARSPQDAHAAAASYHKRAIKIIGGLPNAQSALVSGQQLAKLAGGDGVV
jgi:GntR family transcriptional repressor for pyruvate dehydrogenase complex